MNDLTNNTKTPTLCQVYNRQLLIAMRDPRAIWDVEWLKYTDRMRIEWMDDDERTKWLRPSGTTGFKWLYLLFLGLMVMAC